MLYRGFDLSTFDAAAVAVIRDFLARQDAVQRGLTESLAADPAYAPHVTPAAMERNRLLVSAVDRLSIAICTALADVAVRTDEAGVGIIRNVPAADGAVDLRVTAIDHACTRFTVSPLPFGASAVTLFCEGIALSASGWSDETAMRQSSFNTKDTEDGKGTKLSLASRIGRRPCFARSARKPLRSLRPQCPLC